MADISTADTNSFRGTNTSMTTDETDALISWFIAASRRARDSYFTCWYRIGGEA